MKFISQLRIRNPLLYWFGWINLLGAFISLIMVMVTNTEVLGINAWIKPMKFYISIAVFCWTMAWYLQELEKKRAVRRYSIMLVVVFVIEMVIITWQAANGRLSHFNVSSPLYGILFSLMGIAITVLGIWTIYIAYLFSGKKNSMHPWDTSGASG